MRQEQFRRRKLRKVTCHYVANNFKNKPINHQVALVCHTTSTLLKSCHDTSRVLEKVLRLYDDSMFESDCQLYCKFLESPKREKAILGKLICSRT